MHSSSISLLQHYIREKNLVQALHAYRDIKDENKVSLSVNEYSSLIRIASEHKRDDVADAIFKRATADENVGLHPKLIATIMFSYLKLSKFTSVVDLYQSLDKDMIKSDPILTSLALSAFAAVSHPEADALFASMEGKYDEQMFEGMVRGYLRREPPNFEKANAYLDQMAKFDFVPSLSLWKRFIRSLCHENKLRAASDLTRKMAKSETPPDVMVFQMLMNCAMKSEPAKLLGMFDLMKECGVSPTLSMISSVIKESSAKGEDAFVVEFGDAALRHGVSVDGRFYSNLIQAANRSHNYQRAVDYYKLSRSNAARIMPFAFSHLVHACRQVHDVETVMEALLEAPKCDFHPNIAVYNKALGTACRANNLDQAFRIKQMIDNDPRAEASNHTYGILISQCIKTEGHKEEVQELVAEMKQRGIPQDAVLRRTLEGHEL